MGVIRPLPLFDMHCTFQSPPPPPFPPTGTGLMQVYGRLNGYIRHLTAFSSHIASLHTHTSVNLYNANTVQYIGPCSAPLTGIIYFSLPIVTIPLLMKPNGCSYIPAHPISTQGPYSACLLSQDPAGQFNPCSALFFSQDLLTQVTSVKHPCCQSEFSSWSGGMAALAVHERRQAKASSPTE